MEGIIYFVDEANGDDSNSGLTVDDAFATADAAEAHCEASAENAISEKTRNNFDSNGEWVGPWEHGMDAYFRQLYGDR